MNSMKMMMKVYLGIGLLVLAAYAIVPTSRAGIAAVAPYLLLLLPLALCCFMMMGMASPKPKDKPADRDDK